jgi:hypothetical protein
MASVSDTGSADNLSQNTSGQGQSAVLPDELKGWNWGAFLLTWIWGISNEVWLALLALIPLPMIRLVMAIILGIKGNEWAWQSKKWDSIEHFRRTQRIWLIWGIVALFLPFILITGIALIVVGILGYYGYIEF